MSVKLIIFDLDGTLIDAYGAIIDSLNYTMSKLGLPSRSGFRIKRAVGWGDKNLVRPFVPGRLLNKALDIYRIHHKKALLKRSRLLPFARRLLFILRQKRIKLAVASNRPTKFSLILLRHLKIKDCFDYILCADKLKFGKPHPLILNMIVKKMRVKKREVLYAGDMVLDAQAGRRANIKTIIVLGGSSTREEIKKEHPFKIVRGLRSVVKVIDAR
jgi:phosphoglycolate phosphatase